MQKLRKAPDQYMKGLRKHWRDVRKGLAKAGSRIGSVNDCWTPSAGASKADLKEFHQEEMKLRRRRQRNASTRVTLWLEKHPNWDHRNYSRHPKGARRRTPPVYT
jgi:hypothetical protein